MSRFPHNILAPVEEPAGTTSRPSQPQRQSQSPPPRAMATPGPSSPRQREGPLQVPPSGSPLHYSYHSHRSPSSGGPSSSLRSEFRQPTAEEIHNNPPSRRTSGGSNSAAPSPRASVAPTIIVPPSVQQHLGTSHQQQQRTTLPPLSSFTSRPSSNSLSAIPTASISFDWDQSRPRAASASGPVINVRRGNAPPYHRAHGVPATSLAHAGRQQFEHDQSARPAHPEENSIARYPSQEPTSLPGPSPYHAAPPASWSAHHQPPHPPADQSHLPRGGYPTYTSSEGRPRASSGASSTTAYDRSRPEPIGQLGVLPSGATVAASDAMSAPPPHIRAASGASKSNSGSTTTTHMAGTISSSSAHTSQRPSLDGFIKEQDGKRYRLVVVQSPNRARMCGFGDKDRRPLSPTLIVKLIITDTMTNQDIAPTDVDTSAFFLAADLVHPEDLKAAPRNLLVHQHAASVATDLLHHSSHAQGSSDAAPNSGPTFEVDRVRTRSLSDPWSAAQVTPSWGGAGRGFSSYQQGHPIDVTPAAPYTTVTTETYTRNFVGASVASANILKDENDHLGIFFVLQDLSVRTEGVYRIKLMFVNLAGSQGQIKMGVSEALAETYTEPFTVYTPRRFPGVIEPTALSKKFAAQGVKIPVRVDRKKRRRDSGEDGDAGYGDEDGDSG